MASGKRSYTVQYERDADSGAWSAVIDRRQGVSCVTQGRSLSEARKRIREALALYLDDGKAAAAAELIDDVKLPGKLRGAVAGVVRLREQAQKAQAVAQERTAAAAQQLAAMGISTRDAAELLDVSHQHIAQIARGDSSSSVRRKVESALAGHERGRVVNSNAYARAAAPARVRVAAAARSRAKEAR